MMQERRMENRQPVAGGTATVSPSDDELKMIEFLATGRSVKEIAISTGRHPNTVYDRLSRLRGRFGLHNDVELVAYAIRQRWIH
jgi:DNA-binding CsgD family transcriptional regulator